MIDIDEIIKEEEAKVKKAKTSNKNKTKTSSKAKAKEEKTRKAQTVLGSFAAGAIAAGTITAAALAGNVQVNTNESDNSNNNQGTETSVDNEKETQVVYKGGFTYDDVENKIVFYTDLKTEIDAARKEVAEGYHYTPEGQSWSEACLTENDKLDAQEAYIDAQIDFLTDIDAEKLTDDDNYLDDEAVLKFAGFLDDEQEEIQAQVSADAVANARTNVINYVKYFKEANDEGKFSFDKLSKEYGTQPKVFFVYNDINEMKADILHSESDSEKDLVYIEEDSESAGVLDHTINAKEYVTGQWGTLINTKVKELVKTTPVVRKTTPAPTVTPVTPEKPVTPPETPVTPPETPDQPPVNPPSNNDKTDTITITSPVTPDYEQRDIEPANEETYSDVTIDEVRQAIDDLENGKGSEPVAAYFDDDVTITSNDASASTDNSQDSSDSFTISDDSSNDGYDYGEATGMDFAD